MRRSIMKLTTAIVALCSCGGASEEPAGSATRCSRMRDRLVELNLADTAGVDHTAHRRAMLRASGAELVRACERAMTADQIDCVLGAADAAAALACATRTHDWRPARGDW